MSVDLTYLSFGAGVQSTALLGLCLTGAPGFTKPDVVIHADTQSDLRATERHVQFMRAWTEERGVKFVVSSAGSLEAQLRGLKASRTSGYVVSIPSYTLGGGMLRRQCTRHHKIDVIRRVVREELGLAHGQPAGDKRARALIGISYDEAGRMKDSRDSWIENAYPLVEARMSRWDCEDAIRRLGLPVPPKSSCVFCPYHDDAQWAAIQRDHPEDFARAVAVDEAARDATTRGADDPAFLHRDRRPLKEINFQAREAERRAQGSLFPDGFGEECEGMCGT